MRLRAVTILCLLVSGTIARAAFVCTVVETGHGFHLPQAAPISIPAWESPARWRWVSRGVPGDFSPLAALRDAPEPCVTPPRLQAAPGLLLSPTLALSLSTLAGLGAYGAGRSLRRVSLAAYADCVPLEFWKHAHVPAGHGPLAYIADPTTANGSTSPGEPTDDDLAAGRWLLRRPPATAPRAPPVSAASRA